MLTALNCPNCGAPLNTSQNQNRAVCLYCNSTLHIDLDEGNPSASLESTMDEAEMAKVKQLLLDGQPQSAQDLYVQITGSSPETAQEALADLGRKLSLDVVRQQQLTTSGIVLVVLYGLFFLVGLWILVSGIIHWLTGLIMTLFGAWMLYFYYPALASTLKYRRGRSAQAKVLKLAEVGVTRLGRQSVRVISLLVEVQPDDRSAPYWAEIQLPVREENVPRAQVGTSFRVKYLPDDPEKIIFTE